MYFNQINFHWSALSRTYYNLSRFKLKLILLMFTIKYFRMNVRNFLMNNLKIPRYNNTNEFPARLVTATTSLTLDFDCFG